jgi:hypothetical protein
MMDETSQKTTVLIILSFLRKITVCAALIRKNLDSFQLQVYKVARNGYGKTELHISQYLH